MKRETLTLRDIAKAVAPHWRGATLGNTDDEESLALRRIRHWTLAGALPTSGAVHAGTGRHRHYPPVAAYLAAILTYMADWGLPIGLLKAVSEGLLASDLDNNKLWLDAVEDRNPVFLSITPHSPTDRGYPKDGVGLVLVLLTEDGMIARVKKVQEGSFLNITSIFRDVVL
jgi:hypothetical protein